VSGIALHLRGEVRGVLMDWLRAQRPDLVPRYERLYGRGAYAPSEERARLSKLVRRPGMGSGFRLRSSAAEPDRDDEQDAGPAGESDSPRPGALQTSLF
jgi:hypothetical protein